MRFVAPPPEAVADGVWTRAPLDDWSGAFDAWMPRPHWPSIEALDAARAAAQQRDGIARPRIVAQDRALLDDGLHYEQRIAAGLLATREASWHDLFNALVWLRFPRIKRALNAGQVAGIAAVGTRERTRVQCALTHFDEAGAIVLCDDDELIACWDAHDWKGLFHARRDAWGSRIAVHVFGHALLEHALCRDMPAVAKAVVLRVPHGDVAACASAQARDRLDARVAAAITGGVLLDDPQHLRPLPLAGVPGWHPRGGEAAFYDETPCFRPLREGRRYPAPQHEPA